MSLRTVLQGALVMGPMTKGSNLPYRRLCVELGARVTMSEMTVARRLKQRRKGEFALIRRFEGEPFFGVQLAGTNPEEMGWAAELVESRGADLVDLNCGCPIDHFTHKGIGASLGRQPNRQRRIIETMKKAVKGIPVTAKIRLGWNDDDRNALDQARAVADGGADAITVHGRTRNARYRTAADWDAIASIAAAVSIPVIGNGDVLFGHEVEPLRAGRLHRRDDRARGLDSPVAVSRSHRGIPRPVGGRSHRDLPPLRHAGEGALGERRPWAGARAHVHAMAPGVLVPRCRRHDDGTFPSMQVRERELRALTPLDALLTRTDAPAHDYLTDVW